MNSAIPSGTCLLFNVGMVAGGHRCFSIIENLQAMKPSGLRLVAVANVRGSALCCKFAEEMGIEVFEDYRDLLSMEHLDMVLELTGEKDILSDIIARKPAEVGVLDRQASLRLIDMAQVFAQTDRREPEDFALETPLAATLLEASHDGVLVIDRKFRIMNCNKSELIPGSEDRAIIGKHCFEIMYGFASPCSGPAFKCPARETLDTGKVARTVYEITGANKTTQICQATAYPIFSRTGKVVQFVLTIRDMTGDLSERVEKRTQAMKKDLARLVQEDRLSSLGQLVASVCHEINNPITSIVTFTKIVQKVLRSMTQRLDLPSGEMSDVDRYLDLSFREAMRCGNIVKNLLTFARPKSMEAKVIEISELVNTIRLLTNHHFHLANVSCTVDLPDGPFATWGDYAQLQQCLLNLIFNALDAMPRGGTVTIAGGTDEQADMSWLSVSDTGQGIDPQDLPRIFEPFYSTKTGKGNGLGLSMVYGIIREHKGVVEVESEPGKGTTFRIKLPRGPARDGSGDISAGPLPASLLAGR
ncbi:MAG: ATP-binding protein [Syntrophobacteraceae bacterium]